MTIILAVDGKYEYSEVGHQQEVQGRIAEIIEGLHFEPDDHLWIEIQRKSSFDDLLSTLSQERISILFNDGVE